MNIEHDALRVSPHDFNELEGPRSRRFLNIKGEGAFPRTRFGITSV
jgi:hypothetical protein